MASGLSLDALVSSHPIYIPVNHPSEIDEIFDSISYSKVSRAFSALKLLCLIVRELEKIKYILMDYLHVFFISLMTVFTAFNDKPFTLLKWKTATYFFSSLFLFFFNFFNIRLGLLYIPAVVFFFQIQCRYLWQNFVKNLMLRTKKVFYTAQKLKFSNKDFFSKYMDL